MADSLSTETLTEETEPDKVRRKRRGSKRRKRKMVVRSAAVAGAVVVAGSASAGWLAYRADELRGNLQDAVSLVPQLQERLTAGDSAGAQNTLRGLQDHTAAARDAGNDPLWRAASFIPWLGPNFHAATEVAVSADDIVNRAAAPLLDKYSSLDWNTLSPANGRIDVQPLRDAAPTIVSAANTVQLSHDRLTAIDISSLLSGVADPLAEATDTLGTAGDALDSAADAAQLLPSMLGAEGPRNYLLLIQNSAEIRATGGIPGAVAVVNASDGTISLTDQGSASDIGRINPALDVDPTQEGIYTTRLGAYLQDVNLTPDFPTAALTSKRMWESVRPGTHIDGVIAIDPVVLSHMLRVTGPIDLGTGSAVPGLPSTLSADNVVDTLLSDVYAQIEEPKAQDAYFATVAQRVFDAVVSGGANSEGLVQALITSAAEDRVLVWSDHSSEQGVLRTTELAGAATGPDVGGATFGLYFNDGTGAKMDYYVRRTAQLIQRCQTDGYSEFTVRVTLENTAPTDAATALPEYVTGGGVFGVDPGTVRTNITTYGPTQALVHSAVVDGEKAPLGAFEHGDRPVAVVTAELAPGESTTVDVDFSNVVQHSEPRLDITPTIQDPVDVILPLKREGSCG